VVLEEEAHRDDGRHAVRVRPLQRIGGTRNAGLRAGFTLEKVHRLLGIEHGHEQEKACSKHGETKCQHGRRPP
jgi:hypothetical protein